VPESEGSLTLLVVTDWLAQLGAGGMVSRAADTKLGRELAIVGADSGACAPPGLA